jgi:hypothetical protein
MSFASNIIYPVIYVGTEKELMHRTAYKDKNGFDTRNYFYIQLTSNGENTSILD